MMPDGQGIAETPAAAMWRPTGDTFFRRLTRDTLLAYGLEWFGAAWQQKHKNDKKKDLVALLDAFFNGEAPATLTPEQRDIRERWLPAGFVAETREYSLP